MIWRALFTAALLATRVSAAGISSMLEDGRILVRAADVLERRYDDVAKRRLDRRQMSNPTFESDVTLNPDGTINMPVWEAETEAACQEALSLIDVATNPSGTCICYNLPFLNTSSGVFQADLRVYKVSNPSGVFSGIRPQDIMVGLSYNGASVSKVAEDLAEDKLAQRDLERRVEDPELLRQFLFTGQIDPARMRNDMTMADFEELVMPVLSLTGVNSTGQTVSTNVSSNEAAFVVGVFSQEIVMSEFALASFAVEQSIGGLQNGTVTFVVPGVQIMIFPIGLVITGVWLLIGAAAYGYGTYERVLYADSYRRRKAMAVGAVKR